jgi:hypothetical protein
LLSAAAADDVLRTGRKGIVLRRISVGDVRLPGGPCV